MHKWILLPLLGGGLHGAVIRGTVLESQTGHALSRATVVVEPVPGSAGTRMSTHTNRFGFFEVSEPAGMYLLQASRIAFYPAQYGQKRWNSAGTPLTVTESETTFVTFRLLRFGAIDGTVVDENDVGMPEFDVAAYLDVRPPQLVATGKSDDRGAYSIYGLLPGNYVVRSAGHQMDDIGYKPTYGRETDTIDQARSVSVEMEQQVERVNVRPLPGRLFTLSVSAAPSDPPDAPVTITIASEMGRQTIKSPSHDFTGLAPGDYEVFAEAPSDPGFQSNYQRINLGRDTSVSLPLRRTPPVRFQFDGAPLQSGGGSLHVLARRKDLAGTYDMRTITAGTAFLVAGTWEFVMSPVDGYYASGFSGSGSYRRVVHPEGWNEAMVNSNGGLVRFALSSNVGSLHGFVKDSGDAAVGAPVFLEPVDLEPARRLTNVYVAITDLHGLYRFPGVPPGRYRLLSSFEYQMPDSKTMVNAGAKDLQIDSRSDNAADLDLYVIR